METRKVISSIQVTDALRAKGTYTIEVDDAFMEWFNGDQLKWIGDCSGYNFESLPESVKEVIKEADLGYVGIWLDY